MGSNMYEWFKFLHLAAGIVWLGGFHSDMLGEKASVLHAAPVHEVDFLVDAAARGVQRRGRSESLLSVLAQLEARDRGLRAQRRA